MGKMSREKGALGEREAAEKLNAVLGTKYHRGRQYHGGVDSPDLAGGLPGLHVEVKRVESLRLYPSLEQARADGGTGNVPVVMHRPNRKEWVVILYADDLIRLLDVVDEGRAKLAECAGAEGGEQEGSGGRPEAAGEKTGAVGFRYPAGSEG